MAAVLIARAKLRMAHLFFKLIRASRRHLENPDVYMEMKNRKGIQFCHRNDIPRAVQENPEYNAVCEVSIPQGQIIEPYKEFKFRAARILLRRTVPLKVFIEGNYGPSYIVECDPENVQFVNNIMLDTEMWRAVELNKGAQHISKNGMRSEEEFFTHLRRILYLDIFKRAIQLSPRVLEYAAFQHYDLCKQAVELDGICLKYIRSWNAELAEIAVSQNGMALAWCLEQTRAICLAAVRQNPMALKFVENKTEEICREAVTRNGYAIQYMNPQSLECARLALQENKLVFDFLSGEAKEVFGARRKEAAEALDRAARMV